jgi:NAD(P) transhydrogenase subunit alpha
MLLVLGACVAGLQAIATARRLGAVVSANDIRPEVKEQVESLGGKFVDTGTPPKQESTSVYAKETSHEYQVKQRQILTDHMRQSDVLITTALIPGRKAPILVTADMVKAMRPGSVIVDMAVSMGGNVEGSKAGETVTTENGVRILGEPNLAGMVAADSSQMYARNIAAFLDEIVKEGKIEPDWDNEVVIGTLVTRDGEIKNEPSAEALQSKGAS